jgi:hypothetical protein
MQRKRIINLVGRRELNLPYGLVDAGRQWQLAFERWLLDIMGFVTVPSMPQVFVTFDPSGSILLLVGKVVDDVIIAGATRTLSVFLKHSKVVGSSGRPKSRIGLCSMGLLSSETPVQVLSVCR